MPAFNIELTETMGLSDTFIDPFSWSITINGVDYSDNYVEASVTERLNEPYYFNVSFFNLSLSDKTTNVTHGKRIVVKMGSITIIEGQIEDVINETDEITKISCMDMGIKLKARGFQEATVPGRYEKTSATAINTIVNEIRSTNLNGSSPFLINAGVNDQTATVTFKAENMDRLKAIAELARVNNKDWWVDQSSPGVDQINLTTRKGSISSVRTYTTEGANQNIWTVNREVDRSQLWNRIVVLGQGDGQNQIRAVVNDATSQTSYGIIEKTIVDRRIKSTTEATALANKILAEHKDPVNRIKIEIDEQGEVIETLKQVEIGDSVTVTDSDTELSSTILRLVERQIDVMEDEEIVTMTLENKRFSYIENLEHSMEQIQTNEGNTLYQGTVGATGGAFKHKMLESELMATDKMVIGNALSPLADLYVETATNGIEFNANYVDMDNKATPANPASGTRRMFVNSATGELSVRTNAGTTVSLEAGGSGVSGSGTTNFIPKWTAATTLGNTAIEEIVGAYVPNASFSWGNAGSRWQGIFSTNGDFSGTSLAAPSATATFNRVGIGVSPTLKLQVAGGTTETELLRPSSDNLYDLGESGRRWRNLYTGGTVLSAVNANASFDRVNIGGSGTAATGDIFIGNNIIGSVVRGVNMKAGHFVSFRDTSDFTVPATSTLSVTLTYGTSFASVPATTTGNEIVNQTPTGATIRGLSWVLNNATTSAVTIIYDNNTASAIQVRTHWHSHITFN